MIEQIFSFFDLVDNFFWIFLGAPALVILGIYFSFKAKWFQVFSFPKLFKTFYGMLTKGAGDKKEGVHPMYTFFASLGGCVGIGNVVGVCTAVQIGGPGAVFWMWLTALLGMVVKYAEIYLGVKYRVKNNKGGYEGGPMIFLQKVFKSKFIPALFCVLMCVYGVEIYMFRIMSYSISTTWHINEYIVVFVLLAATLFAGEGGVRRVGKISTVLIPLFLVLFVGMSFWIFFKNMSLMPKIFANIFISAFTGHAAIGGFIGSTFAITMSQGIRRACYTGDLGIGYAAIIHSETSEKYPQKEALAGIFSIIVDTFILCTLSVLLILVTGTWKDGIHESEVVAAALRLYFPYVDFIWPFFLFLLGYSTVIAFFAVGKKTAFFLSPKYGEKVYFWYAIFAFILFSFIGEPRHSLMIMSICGMALLILNLIGMFKLRKEISFEVPEKD
jgi:alanine or glycine:cation symporter, AGCS family